MQYKNMQEQNNVSSTIYIASSISLVYISKLLVCTIVEKKVSDDGRFDLTSIYKNAHVIRRIILLYKLGQKEETTTEICL